MSTYYEVLQVSETASLDIIKQKFQQLILQHHPDKRTNDNDDTQAHNILKAWEVLRNPTSRKNYDIELQSQRNKKDVAIGAEVDLDDMEYDENDRSFSLVCRCSGEYVITEDELEAGIDVVGCNNCSLRIRVLYDVVEEDEEDS
ncbi:DnaJ homolog subfamily C member 24 [Mucor ambiguus]|uniref:Diphthamide biosynthesis protein 4 n=1 Tax=Mucor ambiguus TaxID=91626 RepID=A0A0C9LVQ1_9FUNG|nr:DnaJ homolog subfamily C member 24 [Mucor ambiguus]